MTGEGDGQEIPHYGGDPCKIRLTALQQDVLYWLFEDAYNSTDVLDDIYEPVIEDIQSQLPEQAILTRPPSTETLIEAGYWDRDTIGDNDE